MTDLKTYIKNIYPNWIRLDAYNDWSITDIYDEVRDFTFSDIVDNITLSTKQLLITTATLEGIIEWENYLWVKFPNRTLEERRANLLSRVAWTSWVLSLMKAIVYIITWWWPDSVTFIEHWTIWATWDNVFKYEVKINDNLISLTYDTVVLREILEWMQPAHCTLIITITNDLIDAISLTSSTLNWYLLTSHIWWDWTWSITWWTWNPETWYIWWI